MKHFRERLANIGAGIKVYVKNIYMIMLNLTPQQYLSMTFRKIVYTGLSCTEVTSTVAPLKMADKPVILINFSKIFANIEPSCSRASILAKS